MPLKRPGIKTGVPTAQVVKAAQQEATMSQNEDLELAQLEAELGAMEAEGQETAGQEAAEDIDAELAEMMDAQEDLEEALEDQEATTAAAKEPAAAAKEPADAAAEPAAAKEPIAAADTASPTAEQQEHAPAESERAGPPSAGKKQPAFAAKRKGFQVVKAHVAAPAAAPAAAATAPEPTPAAVPAAATKPSAPVAKKKKVLGRAAPPEDAPAAAAPAPVAEVETEMEADDAAAAADKENAEPVAGMEDEGAKLAEPDAATAKPKAPKAAKPKAPKSTDSKADKSAEPKGPKKPRALSAYQVFCREQTPIMREQNPKAGMPELSKLLAAAWRDVSDVEKAEWKVKAQEATAAKAAEAAAAADKEAVGGGDQEAKPAKAAGGGGKKKRSSTNAAEGDAAANAPSHKRAKGKTGKKRAADEEAAEAEAADRAAVDPADIDVDDEKERMECDWEKHPAECILSATKTGKYVVLRKGLGLEEYGLVDATAAKAQRRGGPPGPVSVEMIEEYEEFVKSFQTGIYDYSDGGDLLLEDLPPGSVMESCFYLGKMREPGYEMNKKQKGDVEMKVPLLATCRVVQRVLSVERCRANEWRERALAAEAQLASSSGSEVAAAMKAAGKAAGMAAEEVEA